MKIAIVGYGRMGHEIEQVAKERKHHTVAIDSNNDADYSDINNESMKDVDAVIDFSSPESATSNAKKYAELGVNVVMGTTGWYDEMEKMRSISENIGFIWSGNFSIGVNVFFKVLEHTSKIMNNVDAYDVLGFELHHKGKKDSPSGTAKMMADIMLKKIDRKEKIVTEKLSRKIEDNELQFASARGGSIPGTHKIIFDSEADSIELTHQARSRKGFATGAVMAAEWIKDKKGFYHIDDFMKELIKEE